MRLVSSRLLGSLVVLALSAVLALAGPAAAQQTYNPFDLVGQGAQATTTTVAPTTTGQTNQVNDGFQTWQGVLIVIGGIILLFGIAFAIMRDARKRAPVEDEGVAREKVRDSHGATRNAKSRQRAKAKSVRAQRKHNR